MRFLLLAWLVCLSRAWAASPSWPELSVPVRTSGSSPQDAAVWIGVEHYRELPSVPYALQDADAFTQWALWTRGIRPSRIHTLHDPDGAQILRTLDTALAQVGPQGTLWILFSGHGAIDQKGGRNVLTLGYGFEDVSDDEPVIDTRGEHLLLGTDETSSTGTLSIESLQQRFEADDAGHILLMVDASFSGIARDGSWINEGTRSDVPPPPPAKSDRIVTWLAAAPAEQAGPLDEARMGLFSWHALATLRGWADGALGRTDGHLSLEEAQIWTRRRIAALGREQHPTLDPRAEARAWVLLPVAQTSPDLSGLETKALEPLMNDSEQEVDEDLLTQEIDIPFTAAQRKQAARQRQEALSHAEEPDPSAQAEAQLRARFTQRASEAWARAYRSASMGLPDAIDAIRLFIDMYGDVTFFVTGRAIHLSAPEIPLARRMLANGGRPKDPLLPSIFIASGSGYLGQPSETEGFLSTELLTPFSIPHALEVSRTPITQTTFKGITGLNPSTVQGPDLPVTGVSWMQAVLFCNALSKLDGFDPAYDIHGTLVRRIEGANGWRLPTEAEWILIASDMPKLRDDADACAHANLAGREMGGLARLACDDGETTIAPVSSKRASPSGLYGLWGNVWEWTEDAWAALSGQPEVDPRPDRGRLRVIKGGSFRSSRDDATTGARQSLSLTAARDDVGFRVVRSVPDETP